MHDDNQSGRRTTRRTFAAQAARAIGAATLFPAIVPRSVFGAQAPSNRIEVAMLGTGRQAMKPNLPQFLALPDVQVVAVCDVDGWRMEQARTAVDQAYGARTRSGTYTACATYRDFRDVLAQSSIDAVMISTPDHWHVPMGILAARAGKHISVEKPLSISIAGGRALCRAVEQHKVVSRTDSEFRSLQPFWRACELVRNGRIGQLQTIRTGVPPETPPVPSQPDMPVPPDLDYEMWLGPAPFAPYTERRVHAPRTLSGRPHWMRISDYANGMIANWGTHLNDIAQWANGTERTGPVEVEGTGTFSQGLWNTITSFDLRYRYANGVVLYYKLDRPYIRFEGTEGWIEVGYPDQLTASRPSILSSAIGPQEISFADTLSDKEDFIRAVKTGGTTLEPVEVGHRTVSICQIGLIAVTLGYPLTWDPERERFTDNAANAMLTVPSRATWDLT
jgi:myo-inositol 2-dehydrogenase / D-chiro-inositol 1-dehydrogenase